MKASKQKMRASKDKKSSYESSDEETYTSKVEIISLRCTLIDEEDNGMDTKYSIWIFYQESFIKAFLVVFFY